MLLKWDTPLVLGKPLLKGLQRGVEASGDVKVAGATEVLCEIPIELEHIAEIIRAWETQTTVHLRGHVVVPYLLPQCFGQRLSHLRTGQMFACNADGLTDKLPALLEDAVGALSDVLCGDAWKFLFAHGHGDRQLAVRAFLGAHAEIDKILPVERGKQECGRHGKFGEHLISLALGIQVRNLVVAHEGWHARVAERYPLTRVFEGGPNDVFEAIVLRCRGHGLGLGEFLLG